MKSKHEHKQILLFFMSDTSGFEMNLDKDTETWTNFFGGRGDIYHVSDKTYDLFYHMELELCKYFNLRASVMGKQIQNLSSLKKFQTIIKSCINGIHYLKIIGDILVINDELYITIIIEFVTVRGFSFAASIVEAYKKVSSKNLQKIKGLRKTIPN